MRYLNQTKTPKYSAVANKLINPGAKSSEINDLSDTIDRLVSRCGQLSILLSERDIKSLRALKSKLNVDQARLLAAMEAGKDPTNAKPIYEQTEAIYKEKQKVVSKMIKDHAAKEARINAESNFILPDGTPVGKEEASVVQGVKVKEGTKIEPKIVEKPMSMLDILAHNAKVSTEREQTKPLTGKAAVEARKGIPGMPSLPGIDKQVENLQREQAMAAAMKAGVTPVVTTDMLESGKKNNYNRK